VAHQIFVGIAQNVVAIGAVAGEVQVLRLEDADQVGQLVDLLLALTKKRGIVEVCLDAQAVGLFQRADDLLVDLVADVALALEGHHVLETGAGRNGDFGKRLVLVLVTDVLDEQQHQHVILVLAGVHAAAQFVATGPKLGIEV
jgi:hypothetical protein